MTYACWALGLLGFAITVYCKLADPLKTYALREHDLSYSAGLIFKKTITQPILRIQHIELKRGPIERKVGLATLQVFSAGGALDTFEIPGLPLNEAQKLREFILRYKGSTQHA
jgi:membrane protein YdbS with pleckstrin-like domain